MHLARARDVPAISTAGRPIDRIERDMLLMIMAVGSAATISAAVGPAGASSCAFEIVGRGCSLLSWDLAGLDTHLGGGALRLNDSWPEPYLVAPPCQTVDVSACPACKAVCTGGSSCGEGDGPVGVQLEPFKTNAGGADPKAPCSEGSRCYAIGGARPRAQPIDPADPELGLHLAYPGGDAGRELHHWVYCNRNASATTIPTTLVTFDASLPGYNVNWTSALGCPTVSKSNCSSAGIPKPTPEQLAWQQGEIMALIHFNMATFYGEESCGPGNWLGKNGSSNPENFAPTHLDTDNWAASMKELGVKESVLTAKHGCGFCIWPTTAKLPDGSPYGYNVNPNLDVIGSYVQSMQKAGIGHGFYYSLGSNFYLQRGLAAGAGPNISASEFQSIEVYQLTELWTRYGNLTEIWLDGGFSPAIQAALQSTFQSYQPRVVAFNGGGATQNAVRWVGTEGDMGAAWGDGIWSTYCCNGTGPCVVAHTTTCELNSGPYGGGGCAPTGQAMDAMCNTWYPAGLDYTLQSGDTWFYVEGTPLRPLSELITTYHNCVGMNTVMELDFAIDRTGRVAPAHAALYKRFGAWIRSCYGSAVASGSLNGTAVAGTAAGYDLEITVPTSSPIDRVVLQEDQRQGQRILSYRVVEATTGVVFSKGTSVGNKKIDVGTHNVTGTLRLEVLSTARGLAPLVWLGAYASCPSA